MSFVTRWRVPTPAFTTRWRGPEGALKAVAAAGPETPLSAFVVPPGELPDPGDLAGIFNSA